MATPADSSRRRVAAQALRLAALAAALTAGLAVLAHGTRARVARAEQSALAGPLAALLVPGSYDNDPLADTIEVVAPELDASGRPVTIYRARRGHRPVAAAMRVVAPDGYRGPITLLVAVEYDGTLSGVQVVSHDETPGLGDAFARAGSDWLARFSGLSLTEPPISRWAVRRDGGEFDAFTGATVTPRAIVSAVRRALEYHQAHRERIFSERAS